MHRIDNIPLHAFLFFCFLCFCPIFLGLKFDTGNYEAGTIPMFVAINSKVFCNSLYFSLGALPGLILGLLSDIFSNYTIRSGFKTLTLIVIGQLTSTLIILFFIIPYQYYEMIPCTLNATRLFYSYCLLEHLSTLSVSVWTERNISFLMFIFGVTETLYSFSAFSNNDIFYVSITFRVMSTASLFMLSYLWFDDISVSFTSFHQITKDQWMCGAYTSALILSSIGIWILYFTCGGKIWASYTISYFVCYIYFSTFFVAVITEMNGHIERMAVALSQTAQNSNRMFVRYVSHEIRTPLSIVAMGLDMLQKTFGNEDDKVFDIDSSKHDLCTTLQDIQLSVSMAVEILDDLLTVDKIEGGYLVLDKQPLSPHDLLLNAVQPFFLHVSALYCSVVY